MWIDSWTVVRAVCGAMAHDMVRRGRGGEDVRDSLDKTRTAPISGKPYRPDLSPVVSSRRSIWGALAAGFAVGFLIALLVLAGVVAWLYTSDYIVPGVSVLGIDLGGQTIERAASLLQGHWQQTTIVLDAGSASGTVTPEMLGLLLHADATARQAHLQGRSLASLRQLAMAGWRMQVDPIWSLNAEVAAAFLHRLSSQIDAPPQNAGVRVVDGQVEPLPALKGRVLDTAATLAWLQEHPWEVFAERRLPLVVRPVDPAVTDVSPVIDQVSQLLTAPLTVRLYDPIADEHREWTIPPAVIGDWFVFEVDPADATRLTWRLDPARIEPFLATQSATLGAERFVDPQTAIPLLIEAVANRQPEVKLRIAHPARRHIVKSGETISSIAMDYGIPYPWIEQANPDLGATLFAGQVITIPSPDLLIPLPVVEGKRIVVSISQQRVWVYENGALKWEWPASTGIDSSPTSPGVFQVQTHELNAYASNWNLWMPYFIGIYRPVPTSDFMNGFHGFPSREGSQILWTRNLGSPITYGCILVSTENAKLLFDWAEPGVIVDVRR